MYPYIVNALYDRIRLYAVKSMVLIYFQLTLRQNEKRYYFLSLKPLENDLWYNPLHHKVVVYKIILFK